MIMYQKFISFNQKILFFVFIWWMRLFFNVKSSEKIKKRDRPLVVVANHVSLWDNFIVLSSLGLFSARNVWRIPTAPAYYKKFFYRIFFLLIGTYPLKAKGDIHKSLEESIFFLKNGNSMIYFPEGRIAESKQKGEAKKGLGYLVKEVKVDIVPLFIKHPGRKYCGLFETLKNTRVIIGKRMPSEYFVDNYSDQERSQELLNKVWELNN